MNRYDPKGDDDDDDDYAADCTQVFYEHRRFNGPKKIYQQYLIFVPGPASSDGRACALEMFTSTGGGSNSDSARIFIAWN